MCCRDLKRREFVELMMTTAGGSPLLASTLASSQDRPPARNPWDPDRPFSTSGKTLRVQPVLIYYVPTPKEAASWKSWGGVQTEETAAEEVNRIGQELKRVTATAGFPLEVLPLVKVASVEQAAAIRHPEGAVTIIYAAAGPGPLLRACIPPAGDAIIFVRHRSGPVSKYYETLSVRYLRSNRPPPPPLNSAETQRLSVQDVVVDDLDDLVWRLRALYGVRNFLGARILALGGPMGKYAPEAPQVARERFKLDIVEVRYDDVGKRIRSALKEPGRLAQAERSTDRYLRLPGTTLETNRKFVVNAFVLYGIIKELMEEHHAAAFTINQCMGTILPIAETTACLPLSLLNDEGVPAFCESDFVIIPAGILLRYIAGRPVFLHNSTFPHNGIVTCAHCTAPRRMNSVRYEPARVLTHFESDYGAAPKVEIPKGQEVTFIDPEYATCRWVGIKGVVESNPFYEICRSQQEVRIQRDWKKLLNEVRDSHWVMVYGDFLNEIGYAAPRIGVTWDTV